MAADKIISVNANNNDDDLRTIPQQLMATFVDQGFKQKEISKGLWELKIENLRCDSLSRDPEFPDSPKGGLPSVKCFVNAEIEMGGKGTPIQEGRFVEQLLNTVEHKIPDAQFSDCSMGGKCVTYVKKIRCTVDLNQEEMHNAYLCEFSAENYQ